MRPPTLCPPTRHPDYCRPHSVAEKKSVPLENWNPAAEGDVEQWGHVNLGELSTWYPLVCTQAVPCPPTHRPDTALLCHATTTLHCEGKSSSTSTYALEKQKLHEFCHFPSLYTDISYQRKCILSGAVYISGRVYPNLNNVVMFRPRPFQSSRWDIIARIKLSFGIIMMLLWWRNQDCISKKFQEKVQEGFTKNDNGNQNNKGEDFVKDGDNGLG